MFFTFMFSAKRFKLLDILFNLTEKSSTSLNVSPPLLTSSGLPPLFFAKTGTPQDKASIMELEQQSFTVAETKISVLRKCAAISGVVNGDRHLMFW